MTVPTAPRRAAPRLAASAAAIAWVAMVHAAEPAPVAASPERLGDPPVLRLDQPPKVQGRPKSETRGGLSVDLDSREQSRAFYASLFLGSATIDPQWSGNVAGCDAGDTSTAFKDRVRDRVNYFRAMAGVPADVTLDPTFNAKAQAAALIMAANGALSHDPPSTWSCWSASGDEAAGSSNLSLGHFGPDAVAGQMRDAGASNARVGHRRWILYPQTRVMGTGDVDPPPGTGSEANALWVFDGNFSDPRPAVRDDFVAWPPPGHVPYPVVYARWSLSYPSADFSGATVTMSTGGTPIETAVEHRASGFGGLGENTIVWTPAVGLVDGKWPAPGDDTTYAVTVDGVMVGGVARTFTYAVTVFDPAVAAAGAEVPTLTGAATLATGETTRLTLDPISFAASHELRQATLIPPPAPLGAEQGTSGVVDGTLAAYALASDLAAAVGTHAYHLAHPEPHDQWFELDGEFLASGESRLRLRSRLATATSGQRAHVQVSIDEGVQWVDVLTQTGNGFPGETSFREVEVDLAAYAGKALRVRFLYTAAGSYFPQVDERTGWFVDAIELVALPAITAAGVSALASDTTSVDFCSPSAAAFLLQARAVGWTGHPALAWGPAHTLTVSGDERACGGAGGGDPGGAGGTGNEALLRLLPLIMDIVLE